MHSFRMDRSTKLGYQGVLSTPVRNALGILCRDLSTVFGGDFDVTQGTGACDISFQKMAKEESNLEDEQFVIRFAYAAKKSHMVVEARDDLGMIYAILHVSTAYLGVKPFWYWADQPPLPRTEILLEASEFHSKKRTVRLRGWFINDEVCLKGMSPDFQVTEEIWRAVYEAMLRIGGNVTIFDCPLQGRIAREMGLYVTWHHINPFGARYFTEVYPGVTPSYTLHPEKYEALWAEALERNGSMEKVLWILAFRGQGDTAFWSDDPSASTPQKRADVISRALAKQYQMLQERYPGAMSATYLYGEVSDLYAQGLLEIPDGVIKIWSDNGFGKMVSRRQGNENERAPALPATDEAGPHGLYHHVTFHDLQASNHLTMFSNTAEFMMQELTTCLQRGVDEFWIINCGNIRQHLYFLDLVAVMWREGTISVDDHLRTFALDYHGTDAKDILDCYDDYAKATIRYGEKEDEKAGEEFYHHISRFITTQWMRDSNAPSRRLVWLAGETSLPVQVEHVKSLCKGYEVLWEALWKKASVAAAVYIHEKSMLLSFQLACLCFVTSHETTVGA